MFKSQDPPIACTLGDGDFAERLAWIAALNARALTGARREGLRLELVYRREARADVERMVAQERACCAFLSFVVADTPAGLRVVVQAPEAAREAADMVFAPFLERGTAAGGCGCCAGDGR